MLTQRIIRSASVPQTPVGLVSSQPIIWLARPMNWPALDVFMLSCRVCSVIGLCRDMPCLCPRANNSRELIIVVIVACRRSQQPERRQSEGLVGTYATSATCESYAWFTGEKIR